MRGLLVLSDFCEDMEALGTRALLKRAQIELDTVTYNEDKRITTAYGLTVMVDYHIDEIDLDDYDFLVIPGGKYVAMTIEHDTRIKSLAKIFETDDKMIAAICAGPRFLGEMGILENKKYTIYKGLQQESFNGTYMEDLKAVTDGKLITGRGAGATIEFALEIITFVKSKEDAKQIKNSILF